MIRFFLRSSFYVVLGLSLVGVSGCETSRRAQLRKEALAAVPSREPQPHRLGVVSYMNPAAGFVLVEALGMEPVDGTEAIVKSGSQETARIKFGGERKRPFYAADIVEGRANAGDAVYIYLTPGG